MRLCTRMKSGQDGLESEVVSVAVRIMTAITALAIFVPILLFAPIWWVAFVLGLLAAVAAYEVCSCTGLKKNWVLTVGSMLLVFVAVADSWGAFSFGWTVFLLLLYVICAVVAHGSLPPDKLLMQFAMHFYILFGFGTLAALPAFTGKNWKIWVALCVPWLADTLAYFVGRLFGRSRLCPNISPKKTVEGAVGGVAGTGAVAVVLYICLVNAGLLQALVVCLLAMLLAAISIFGDLFASVVKRFFGVKDYGWIFPGHGGVLDRFDSMLPVVLVVSLLIGPIGKELFSGYGWWNAWLKWLAF